MVPSGDKFSRTGAMAWVEQELLALDREHLRRRLAIRVGAQRAVSNIGGKEMINFGSNDYLALAADPRLTQAVSQALIDGGWGSGSSPLITGHSRGHKLLEERLAEFENTEAALLFPSGFAVNSGIIAALVGPGDVVYTDRKNHASLLDGCRLSRADVRPYPHAEPDRLESLLAKSSHYRRRLIVTDSLFSMDGDTAPLVAIADLADRYGAMLMVDEAHATGVFGKNGRGVCEELMIEDRVHIRVGTLSKAMGSIGGFVVGSRQLIELLVNRARPYVFSTATPEPMVAASLAAMDIIEAEPERRTQLLDRSASLRSSLSGQGWNVGNSTSQIIPLIVGSPERAIALSTELREQGLFVPVIRPPTVPDGEACLRLSMTFGHTEDMLSKLLAALRHI